MKTGNFCKSQKAVFLCSRKFTLYLIIYILLKKPFNKRLLLEIFNADSLYKMLNNFGSLNNFSCTTPI